MSSGRLRLPLVFAAAAIAVVSVVIVARAKPKADKRPPVSLTGAIERTAKDQALQKFNLTGFDEEGKKFWNLEGETAKIEPGQTVFLQENVTLRLKDSTVIRTDKVQWSQDRARLTTSAPVFVDHKDAKIRGVGAEGKPNENFIQLNRHIEMTMSNGAVITCSGPMKLYYDKNKMVFYRNVRVRDSRGILSANRMDVFLEEGNRDVKTIEAVGNVIIERGTDTTHSKKAIYNPATGSLRLEGNPEITLHKGAKLLDAAP